MSSSVVGYCAALARSNWNLSTALNEPDSQLDADPIGTDQDSRESLLRFQLLLANAAPVSYDAGTHVVCLPATPARSACMIRSRPSSD